jgi:hypothetical protein
MTWEEFYALDENNGLGNRDVMERVDNKVLRGRVFGVYPYINCLSVITFWIAIFDSETNVWKLEDNVKRTSIIIPMNFNSPPMGLSNGAIEIKYKWPDSGREEEFGDEGKVIFLQPEDHLDPLEVDGLKLDELQIPPDPFKIALDLMKT